MRIMMIAEMKTVLVTEASEMLPEDAAIATGIPITIRQSPINMRLIMKLITRNGQKYSDEYFQKEVVVNLAEDPFSPLKRPPAKNELIRILIGIRNIKPLTITLIRVFRCIPGSWKTSRSKCVASLSSIILSPTDDFIILFAGPVTKIARRNVMKQIVNTPFHRTDTLLIPDRNAENIFIE
jgi:hypothetical protein